jgi:hypothetical protein
VKAGLEREEAMANDITETIRLGCSASLLSPMVWRHNDSWPRG